MNVPTFPFDRRHLGPPFHFHKRWLEFLKGTGRFFRNARGQVLFLVAEPGEFVQLSRRDELRALIESGDILRIDCPHPLSDDDHFGFWSALYDWRFKLPSAANRVQK